METGPAFPVALSVTGWRTALMGRTSMKAVVPVSYVCGYHQSVGSVPLVLL